MRKSYFTVLLSVGVALGSLSSCSRANFAFNPSTPSYLGTAAVHRAAPVAATPAPELTASTEEATPAPAVTPAPAAAATRGTSAPAAHRAARPAAATETAPATTQTSLTKAERKEVKQALRQVVQQQKAAAPAGVAADGKSQIIAAVLSFFLGIVGVHRFYLGYTGRGILYIALFITGLILFIPLLVVAVLNLIDFIRILTGGLKPKEGDYATKL